MYLCAPNLIANPARCERSRWIWRRRKTGWSCVIIPDRRTPSQPIEVGSTAVLCERPSSREAANQCPRRNRRDLRHVPISIRQASMSCSCRRVLRVEGVEGGKQPYAIARQDGQPMAFGGLWEGFKWTGGAVLRKFTIITTNANEPSANCITVCRYSLRAGLGGLVGRGGRRYCHATPTDWQGCAEGLASKQAGELTEEQWWWVVGSDWAGTAAATVRANRHPTAPALHPPIGKSPRRDERKSDAATVRRTADGFQTASPVEPYENRWGDDRLSVATTGLRPSRREATNGSASA